MSARASSSSAVSGEFPADSASSFWQAWNVGLSRGWLGMGTVLDLQQQSLQRWVLRQQEWARHASAAPLTPAAWLDASLASLRWGAQEWQQMLQDAMAATLMLRGNLGRDEADPWLQWCAQQTAQPLQAWAELWSLAGRRAHR